MADFPVDDLIYVVVGSQVTIPLMKYYMPRSHDLSLSMTRSYIRFRVSWHRLASFFGQINRSRGHRLLRCLNNQRTLSDRLRLHSWGVVGYPD
jgi:hypothetical protein